MSLLVADVAASSVANGLYDQKNMYCRNQVQELHILASKWLR